MAKYKFEGKEIEIVDPTIIKHGPVGGSYENNNNEGVFSVQLRLENDGGKSTILLQDSSMPQSFTDDHIDEWVAIQMEKYRVD